jgi:hypothetical protein
MISLRSVPLVLAVLLASAGPAQAEGRCSVRVDVAVGAGDGDAWRDAVHAIERTIDAGGHNDCEAIVVSPDAHGAAVTFTTRDGRTAVRRVTTPDDLLPLAEALLVASPVDEPSAQGEAVPAATVPLVATPPLTLRLAPPGAEPAPGQESVAAAPSIREQDTRARVVIGAAGGVKGGAPGDAVAPLARVVLGVANAHWEAFAFGRWDVEHTMAATSPAGEVRLGSIGGGVLGGRRQRLGALVLVLGSGVGVYSSDAELHNEAEHALGHHALHDTFAEPRLDAYLGLVVPASSRLRLRMQVEGELALLRHQPSRPEFPAAPGWTMGLTLGAEAAFLP